MTKVCWNKGSFCQIFGLVANCRLNKRHAGQNIAARKVYQGRCPNDLCQINVNRVGNLFASGRMITIFPGCKTTESPKDPVSR